ncbi:MAG: HlyD family efflux transporter periplasmic adaptor subunit [Gammaproteobacteria bacterium]|nr:HlyD family efflux transporter periplasmic adaptor subunit [Gammaproteobacteria bacterium]
MDLPLNPQHLQRKRRRVLLISASVLFGICLTGWLMNRLLTPQLHRSELRIATINLGDIANTINGAGLVIPEHEAQVASPISTRVSKIHVKPGQTVEKDQLLLELDDHDVQLAIENLRQQIAQQDSQMLSLTVDMQQKQKKLHSDIELLELDLASSALRLARFQKLGALGITSQDDLQSAELVVKRTEVQLKQQREAIVDTQKATDATLENARLQQSIYQKQLAQQLRIQERTQVRAPFDGILTWLPTDEGTALQAGELVAKLAQLNNYRVEVSVSDFFSRYLQPGQPVRLEYNKETLAGEVQTILPEINNGTVRLYVSLQQPNHPLLRNKLRIEANIVTEQKQQTLVVERGTAIKGSGTQQVWLLKDGIAEKTTVEFGLADSGKIEVLRGATAGMELIISDLNSYQHLTQIRVTH